MASLPKIFLVVRLRQLDKLLDAIP
jgi:hypothetical protein